MVCAGRGIEKQCACASISCSCARPRDSHLEECAPDPARRVWRRDLVPRVPVVASIPPTPCLETCVERVIPMPYESAIEPAATCVFSHRCRPGYDRWGKSERRCAAESRSANPLAPSSCKPEWIHPSPVNGRPPHHTEHHGSARRHRCVRRPPSGRQCRPLEGATRIGPGCREGQRMTWDRISPMNAFSENHRGGHALSPWIRARSSEIIWWLQPPMFRRTRHAGVEVSVGPGANDDWPVAGVDTQLSAARW